MDQSTYEHNHKLLFQLMQQVGISSIAELSEISGIAGLQLSRLQYGLLPKLNVETMLKLSETLKIPFDRLLEIFCPPSLLPSSVQQATESERKLHADLAASRQEYQRLQQQMEQQKETLEAEFQQSSAASRQEYQRLQQQMEQEKETLEAEFQQSSLETLESWLLQWPTAAAIAQKNPQLSAVKLLPLVKPVVDLLKKWGIETTATVGERVSYNPQYHQLMDGEAQPGDLVRVRYVGYQKGEKLLYRAKVSPVEK